MNYYPNNQYYIQDLQQMRDRIDNQMRQLQQPAPIMQNFQFSSNSNLKFVNSVDDVQREIVIADTYFLANNLSALWLKSVNGNIRTFAIQEIKPKDEKDLMIEDLQRQINELKGANINVRSNDDRKNDEQSSKSTNDTITTTKSTNVSTVKSSKTK